MLQQAGSTSVPTRDQGAYSLYRGSMGKYDQGWGLEFYLKSLKKKITAASVESEGPQTGKGQGREMKIAAARKDRPVVAGYWHGKHGPHRRSHSRTGTPVPGDGSKAEGCSSGSPRLTCSPLVSPTFGLGERVTFTHSSGPPPVSGHPEWGGDRSHLYPSALRGSFMRGPHT